jgi:DNA-binding GntR family transcriptional regulator
MVELLSPEKLGLAPSGKSLSDKLFWQLREDILSGIIPAGSKINITALKHTYGAGLSPLREALTRLAASNLLEQQSQRGFSVPPLDMNDLRDIIALRCEFEGKAVERSLSIGGAQWESEILALGHQLMSMDEDSYKTLAWENTHKKFHAALISRCQSQWRLRFIRQLHDQFDRYRRQAPTNLKVRRILNEQHAQMVKLAMAGQGQQLRELIIHHIEYSGELAMECCQ